LVLLIGALVLIVVALIAALLAGRDGDDVRTVAFDNDWSGSLNDGTRWTFNAEADDGELCLTLRWTDPVASSVLPGRTCVRLDNREIVRPVGGGSFEVGDAVYLFGAVDPSVDMLEFSTTKGVRYQLRTQGRDAYVLVVSATATDGPRASVVESVEAFRGDTSLTRCRLEAGVAVDC
jgi:hypothetical protein